MLNVWRVLCGLLLVLPVSAQVSWVASNNPQATTNPVYANPVLDRVCRVQVGSNLLIGTERAGVCAYANNGVRETSSSFSVAVGLGKWEGASLAGASEGGTVSSLPAPVCRANVGGEFRVGYLTGSTPVCQLTTPGGGFQSSTRYEQLYDFSDDGVFRIRNRDLCMTATNGNPRVLLQTCTQAPAQNWRILESSGNIKFESVLFSGECLVLGSFFGADVIQLGACSGAPSLSQTMANDTTYFLRNTANGQALARIVDGWSAPAALTFRTPVSNHLERFEITTVEEASRRLSVLSYNIMMLPRGVFGLLKQDDRAEWIPQSLNRLGILSDVIGFQEGFDNEARNKVVAQLIGLGYIYFTGVPDFPDSVKDADFLGLLSNGGVFIASRWPIERVGYTVFQNKSQDGLDDTTGLDATAAKGVVYARINKLGRRYHVFNTHLQAGSPSDEAPVRRGQLQEFRTFVNSMLTNSSADDGVVFTGDFNIDMEADSFNYFFMLNTLGVSFVDAPRPVGTTTSADPVRWTVDPVLNDISNKRGSGFEWLDYIFVGNGNAKVDKAEYLVFQPEHTDTYSISVANIFPNSAPFDTKDLSDHGAVFGRLRFAPASTSLEPLPLIDVTLETVTTPGNDPITGGYLFFNGGQVTTPQVLPVVRDEPVEVSANTNLPGPEGFRYVFDSFASGDPQVFTYTPTPGNEKVAARYRTQYQLRATAVPANSGTFTRNFEYFDFGAAVNVTATAAPGFRFLNYTRPETTNPTVLVEFRRDPVRLTANFASLGAPRLSLQTGAARERLPNQTVSIPLTVWNSGVGGATNVVVRLQSVQVLAGSGTFFVDPNQTIGFGTVPVNTTIGLVNYQLFWPETATRVRLNFQITADGYTTPFSLTLFR